MSGPSCRRRSSSTRCPTSSPPACRKPRIIVSPWRTIACCWWARAGSWSACSGTPTHRWAKAAGGLKASPAPLEAGLEALRNLAGGRLAHRAGDAERSTEQLLLGAQRAQPLVVGARNVGAERHARVGREDVEAQRLAAGPAVGLAGCIRQRPRH